MTLELRTLAAEARAVEEGHRAVAVPGGYRVVSDTKPRKTYHVTTDTPLDAGTGLIFQCQPHGLGSYGDDHLATSSPARGHVPCKHAALVARRLEREGIAEWDAGRWVATEHAATTARAMADAAQPDDPFAGLPR